MGKKADKPDRIERILIDVNALIDEIREARVRGRGLVSPASNLVVNHQAAIHEILGIGEDDSNEVEAEEPEVATED